MYVGTGVSFLLDREDSLEAFKARGMEAIARREEEATRVCEEGFNVKKISTISFGLALLTLAYADID